MDKCEYIMRTLVIYVKACSLSFYFLSRSEIKSEHTSKATDEEMCINLNK